MSPPSAAPRASRECVLALCVLAASAQAQVTAPEIPTPLASANADAPAAIPAIDEKTTNATRLRFDRGTFKPGIEGLRVVKRQNTLNNLAGKVALNVAVSLLAGGPAFGARGFSKDELAGEPLEDLQGDPVVVNPAISDLNDALSGVATEIYRRRASAARETALQDGSTAEEIAQASQVPAEAAVPLHPRAWHLVYENLTGSDELFRLKFGAELGRAGFMRPPAVCAYESPPIAWMEWQAAHWQRLRDERAKAVLACTEKLAATPEDRW